MTFANAAGGHTSADELKAIQLSVSCQWKPSTWRLVVKSAQLKAPRIQIDPDTDRFSLDYLTMFLNKWEVNRNRLALTAALKTVAAEKTGSAFNRGSFR